MNSMRTMENLVGSSMSKAAGAENMQLSLFPVDTASAASPEPIDPPSVVSSGKSKVNVDDLVYETKNGVKRMDTAKLAVYIREEGNYFYSNPTNQQDTKQDLNQPIQSEGATAEKAVSMASGKA